MVQINWTFQAKKDLQNIFAFISKDSKIYAKHQIKKIISATQMIKKHPEIGRIVPELKRHEIREIIEGNYRIIYKIVSKNQIDILTVHHSSRNFLIKT